MAVSLSRHCVTVVDVGIKFSFPLISSVAPDVSVGTSSVSKQTLLFSSSPYYFCCLLFCVFYLSVCFPHVGEDFFFLWVPCSAPDRQEREPWLSLARCCSQTLLFAALCGAAAWLVPAPLPSSPLGVFKTLLCLVLCWCYLGCFQEQHRTASSIPKTDTENENCSRIIFSSVKVQLKQHCWTLPGQNLLFHIVPDRWWECVCVVDGIWKRIYVVFLNTALQFWIGPSMQMSLKSKISFQ